MPANLFRFDTEHYVVSFMITNKTKEKRPWFESWRGCAVFFRLIQLFSQFFYRSSISVGEKKGVTLTKTT